MHPAKVLKNLKQLIVLSKVAISFFDVGPGEFKLEMYARGENMFLPNSFTWGKRWHKFKLLFFKRCKVYVTLLILLFWLCNQHLII